MIIWCFKICMIYLLLVYASLDESSDENIQIEQYNQAEMVGCVVDDSCTQITQYIYILIYIYMHWGLRTLLPIPFKSRTNRYAWAEPFIFPLREWYIGGPSKRYSVSDCQRFELSYSVDCWIISRVVVVVVVLVVVVVVVVQHSYQLCIRVNDD